MQNINKYKNAVSIFPFFSSYKFVEECRRGNNKKKVSPTLTRKSFLTKKILKYRRKDSNTDRQTDGQKDRKTNNDKKEFFAKSKIDIFLQLFVQKTFKYRSINI